MIGFKVKKIIAWIMNLFLISDLLIAIERRRYHAQYIRIINYHDTRNDRIAKQIRWLKKHYNNVTYDEFKTFMSGKPLAGSKPGIMLTFDDGLEGNYWTAMRTLKEEKMTGYFMISSDLIGGKGYMSKEQIKELIEHGHVVGCHTATHHRMDKSDSESTLEYEITESKEKLEKMFDIPVDIFCWCGGEEHTYTAEAEKVIEQSGYKYGFMTNSFPVTRETDRFHIQRINVEDLWTIGLMKFQICGLMDKKFQKKRERVNKLTK